MRSRLGIAGVVAFFALLLAGMLAQGDTRALTPTSYGEIPAGYGAFYDLLEEAGLPVARSFASPERLAPGGTLWWIEPAGLVPEAEEADEAWPVPEPAPADSALRSAGFARWIEAGGTAVVLFPGEPGPALTLAERSLPARVLEHPAEGEEDAPAPEPRALPLAGTLASAPRTLELRAPVVFDAVDGAAWRTLASLGGKPFVLEAALGAGRLVLVADARFLSNAWLGHSDAAPFGIDLVRAFGVPRLDEHEHGLASSQGTLAYLAGSSALPFFVGLALLALGFGWFGGTLPMRRVEEFDPSAPTLETFVASLAHLYAATRDHARVLDRYRELTARRLRRSLGLPPDAPLASLIERLARSVGTPRAGLVLLEGSTPVRDEADLHRAVAALDRLVAEVAR